MFKPEGSGLIPDKNERRYEGGHMAEIDLMGSMYFIEYRQIIKKLGQELDENETIFNKRGDEDLKEDMERIKRFQRWDPLNPPIYTPGKEGIKQPFLLDRFLIILKENILKNLAMMVLLK